MKKVLLRILTHIGSNGAFFGSVYLYEDLPGDVVYQLMLKDSVLPPY
ncbi:hypothetical protein [Niallia sp. 01092]